MKCKTIEIRDEGTLIPVLAIKLEPTNDADRFLLDRAGYGKEPQQFILLTKLTCGHCDANYDPHAWGGRTMKEAHLYIEQNFDKLKSGTVVDVEYILGITKSPKKSEAP